MTVVYTTTVLLYYKVPASAGLIDSLIFTVVLFGLGFSMFFAIRYMEVGIKALPELTGAHLGLTAIVTLLAIYITDKSEGLLIEDLSVLPDSLVQGKVFTGVLLYALIVMLYYFSNYQERLVEKQRNEENLKGLLQEAELNLLKSQLNPHFIFNSLNSISSLTVTNPEKAREMVVKLSEFLRYSLGKGENEFVPLEEELRNTGLFIDIEKTRFGERLNVEKEFDSEIAQVEVPVLILQPLIENAVKYAMYDTTAQADIHIKTASDGDYLLVTTKNPYDPDDNSSKGKGIGLNNVRARLELLYKGKAELSIEKSGNTFNAKLKLPLK